MFRFLINKDFHFFNKINKILLNISVFTSSLQPSAAAQPQRALGACTPFQRVICTVSVGVSPPPSALPTRTRPDSPQDLRVLTAADVDRAMAANPARALPIAQRNRLARLIEVDLESTAHVTHAR